MNNKKKTFKELTDDDLFFIVPDDEEDFGPEDFPQTLDGNDVLSDDEEWIDPYANMTDPEDLDRVYYDSWAPTYDFNRPIRVTGVKYRLQTTEEEIKEVISEMKRNNSSELVIVPYYKEGILDPDWYEGLILKQFCTRHLLDNDYQYGAEKWNYYDDVFHFVVFTDEMQHIAGFFHLRLETEMSQEFRDEIKAKNDWYENNKGQHKNYDAIQNAYSEWFSRWFEEHRKK